MTFDRMKFSISRERLIGNERKDIIGLDSMLKDFSRFLDYEYEPKASQEQRTSPLTYSIGTLTQDMFVHNVEDITLKSTIEDITLKSTNIMRKEHFDKLLEYLYDAKIWLINARFYLTESGYKNVINWLSNYHKAYLELSSGMYSFAGENPFLTGFMGNFEAKRTAGLLMPNGDDKIRYVTTIRTRSHEVDAKDSINILDELKKNTYFLK